MLFTLSARNLMSSCDNRSEVIALIRKVRANDQGAFEKILSIYEPLISAAIAKFSNDELSKSHEEDFRQEAVLVFYNSIMSYDIESDGVEFGLYAKICITNALISQSRKLNKIKIEQFAQDFDIGENSVYDDEISSRIIEEESLRNIDRVIRGNLSPFEYRVWCLYASGKTARDIGEIVGKSEKSIANAIYRMRKKLRSLLK